MLALTRVASDSGSSAAMLGAPAGASSGPSSLRGKPRRNSISDASYPLPTRRNSVANTVNYPFGMYGPRVPGSNGSLLSIDTALGFNEIGIKQSPSPPPVSESPPATPKSPEQTPDAQS